MRCSACCAVYSNGLILCPRCQTPAPERATERSLPSLQPEEPEATINEAPAKATPVPSSILIEFPGAGRSPRPQWRKDLSERVREIQGRRGRTDAQDITEKVRRRAVENSNKEAGRQLGLVPDQGRREMNPIVAAALKRIERAQQQPPSRARLTMGGAAVAVARVAEEQYQVDQQPEAQLESARRQEHPAEKIEPSCVAETAREHTLSVVPAPPLERAVPEVEVISQKPVALEPAHARVFEPLSAPAAHADELVDDRAPVLARVAASLIDLLVVGFASSPFAAVIELSIADWADERVIVSMCGIIILVMFLYLTTSTTLAGRTWGMSVLSLRAVDVDTGLTPTTKQAVTRAVAYMVSLAIVGLGILYALLDAEGRTVHDHLSGTTVVRE